MSLTIAVILLIIWSVSWSPYIFAITPSIRKITGSESGLKWNYIKKKTKRPTSIGSARLHKLRLVSQSDNWYLILFVSTKSMLPLPSFPSDKSDFDRSVVCLVFRSDVNPDSFGGVKTKKVWPEIIFFKAIFSL